MSRSVTRLAGGVKGAGRLLLPDMIENGQLPEIAADKAFPVLDDQDILFMPVQGVIQIIEIPSAKMIMADRCKGGVRDMQHITISPNIQIDIFICRIPWFRKAISIGFVILFFVIEIGHEDKIAFVAWMAQAQRAVKIIPFIGDDLHQTAGT